MNFDVVIIGASSSGLYAAELLAQAGRRVAVFERQTELNPARRTYIITPQLQRVLGYLPDPAILHKIDVIAVVTPGGSVEVQIREPDLIIERNLLTHFMAQRAQDAGAEIYYGYLFQGFETDEGQTTLRIRTHDNDLVSVAAKAVIGADGVFSEVVKEAELKHPPVVPILQAEIQLPLNQNAAGVKVWFDIDETRFFYWLIPESEERGVVGLVGNDLAEMRSLLQGFLARHGFQPLAYQAGWVAMHHPRLHPWGQVGSVPVLLVGDAAGQVKATTVGGTVTGFWGAQAAVRALLKRTAYAQELRLLKRELDLHWLIRKFLGRLDNPGYDQLVQSINPAVVEFLGHQNRDEMVGVFWQLPFLQPRLLALGVRHLFSRSHQPPQPTVELVPEPDTGD